MTSSVSVSEHQPPTVPLFLQQQQQQQQQHTRRHIGRPIRVWPFAMECLAETEAETEQTAETTTGHLGNCEGVTAAVVTSSPQPTVSANKKDTHIKQAGANSQSRKQSLDGTKKIVEAESVGCTPFFGVKHYLNNFYGITDGDTDAKIVRIIEPEDEDDYFAIMTAGAGQSKSEVECWHVHRRCFAWSFSVGTLVVLLGVTCLLLGFLLPRHSALVSQMEDNDVKMWMSAHSTNSEPSISSLNIIDRQAIEHNNVLDTLKMGGGIAICFGCFLLLMTLIFPPGSHPSKWADEGETSQISQINQALKNCLLSVHSKTHPTFFYSGLVASTTNEKIPVFQQLQSVQPKD